MQMIFQDPFASLNPHKTVEQIIELPLRIKGVGTRKTRWGRVNELLALVGLDPSHHTRFPHQLSGGQRQRIGIARALACDPELIIADEPVSSLDVSIQAQIIEVLRQLQRRFRLTTVFISHDIAVISYLSQRVAVMYLGRVVELGPARAVIEEPKHPYTRALLAAVPRIGRGRSSSALSLRGDPPSQLDVPRGCRFRTRCPLDQMDECHQTEPELEDVDDGHSVACHLAKRGIR